MFVSAENTLALHGLLWDIERLFSDLYGCSPKKCAEGISKIVAVRSVLNECKDETD
mgnify:CR=1 FL=1